MWPGQQQPGGENPQQQNPYQQPGYHQPNPYQQPGYQQPDPYQQPGQQPGQQQPGYQQPTAPQYVVHGQPPGPPQPPGGGDDKRRTVIVAVVAATAVVATAVITGVVVLKDDDKGTSDEGAKSTVSGTPSAPPSSGGAAPAPSGNPRAADEARPTIAGWKVVTNPRHGTRFDVPADWEVAASGVNTGFEDKKKGDGTPVNTMSAPAHFKSAWCTVDSNKDGRDEKHGLASAGTKGAKGAKDTGTAAFNEAGSWAWAAYAQTEPKGTVKVAKATPYTTKSGLVGSVSTATATGVRKTTKCDTDGKAIAFTFKDAKGDFRTWALYANKGVPDEVPETTVRRILSTVRLADSPTG
ncbi:hypothetical protein [Streptomyces sp. NPDC020965]|uniref:hypothetical protein n=1 Tax=Streptomyces sp. NPDC020965 TaxID=3365105 RepID=UPI0037BE12BC